MAKRKNRARVLARSNPFIAIGGSSLEDISGDTKLANQRRRRASKQRRSVKRLSKKDIDRLLAIAGARPRKSGLTKRVLGS